MLFQGRFCHGIYGRVTAVSATAPEFATTDKGENFIAVWRISFYGLWKN